MMCACTGVKQTAPPEITAVTGTITYREHVTLTPDAEIRIKLLNVSQADTAAVEFATTLITNPGQVPVTFKLKFNPAEIEERYTYVIRADIYDRSRRLFTTDTAYPVLTRGNDANVDLTLIAMNSNPVSKPDASLTETYWKLIVIGEETYTAGQDQREAHLKLHINNAVSGFAGCNTFAGNFTTKANAINLGPLAMTAMACKEGMDTEQSFIRALDEINHYEIHGDTMLGLKGDTITLQFEAVYF